MLQTIFSLKAKDENRYLVFIASCIFPCGFNSYSQVIVDYPLAVLLGCAMLLLGCSLAGLFIGPLPDFSDPLLVSLSHKHHEIDAYTHVTLQSVKSNTQPRLLITVSLMTDHLMSLTELNYTHFHFT